MALMYLKPLKWKPPVLLALFASCSLAFGDDLRDLQNAAMYHSLPRLKAMLDADPSLINRKDKEGRTVLQIAISAPPRTYIDVLDLLFTYKADVKMTNDYGSTPLHMAAGGGKVEVAKWLLDHGADINCRDKWGSTPLHYTARSGRKEMAELLISSNADVNSVSIDVFRNTPMSEAVRNHHDDVVEVLLQHGGHGPLSTNGPFKGWHDDGDIRFHFASGVTNDCQQYVDKNKLFMPMDYQVFSDPKTGKFAITFEACPYRENATCRYGLVYDKNNKRVKVVKYDYVQYHS